MPEDVAKKFVKNTIDLSGVTRLTEVLTYDSYEDMMNNAFTWSKTPEGEDFWHMVYKEEFPSEYVTITLPKPQSAYLVAAANSLKHSLSNFHGNDDEVFDLTTLEALMHYEVSIKISKRDLDKFTSEHGIDFPEY